MIMIIIDYPNSLFEKFYINERFQFKSINLKINIIVKMNKDTVL